MLGWLKNINKKIKDLNISVDNYKKETDNQTMPVHAYINRAKKMIDRSMFLEARDVLNEALSISQKDALIYKYLGICEEKLGNFEGAVDMFQKSASINPQDKNIWHKLGMTQITLKKYE
ncbi:tetratricopeptide repeat protein, partial [bacterium]|nr:tetratricopeptide repeat protein [bacterium]